MLVSDVRSSIHDCSKGQDIRRCLPTEVHRSDFSKVSFVVDFDRWSISLDPVQQDPMLGATDVGEQIAIAEHIHRGLVVEQDVAPNEEHHVIRRYESRFFGPIVFVDLFFPICVEDLLAALAIFAISGVVFN